MASEAEAREKRAVRREVARRIAALSREERADRSAAACRRLLELPEVRSARAVLLYRPLPDELDVRPALRALADGGTRVLLPRCRPETGDLLCVEVHDVEADLAPGSFGILEPVSDRGVEPAVLDVVVLPARAFDRAGNRVGRGAGYYDRLLASDGFRAFRCGVAYDCQVFPRVPAGPRDVPVDAVVTESGVFRPRAGPEQEPENRAADPQDAEDDQGGGPAGA